MDDLGTDGDALAKPAVVLPQGLGGGFGVDGAGVQMLERGWDAVRFGLSADEFFFEVDVLVREDPALDACLGGELRRGERPGGPGWTAVEEPLDRCGDGVAFVVVASGRRGVSPVGSWAVTMRSRRSSSCCSRACRKEGAGGSSTSGRSRSIWTRTCSMSRSVRAMLTQFGRLSAYTGMCTGWCSRRCTV
ncbi:hypothetical protein [Streptomyces sp. NPDC086519]|uniref:hypothetical protein n=1 Tax=Streptomyces sp. NPDC086519 TaxID=3154863 RepID=UPI00341F16B9